MNRLTVEKRATAANRSEQFAACRVVDRGDLGHAIELERQRRAEDWQSVGEVRRAVDWIEDPARAFRHHSASAEFFAKDGVVGKALSDQLAEHALDRDVHFGDEVDRALLVDAN